MAKTTITTTTKKSAASRAPSTPVTVRVQTQRNQGNGRRVRRGQGPNSPAIERWLKDGNPTTKPPLTPAGDAFLKTAFAPPDFADIPFQGVPDKFNGKVTTIKQVLTSTFNVDLVVDPDQPLIRRSVWDVIMVQLPVPGIAAFYAYVPAGQPITPANIYNPSFFDPTAGANSVFGAIVYPETPQMFPSPPASALPTSAQPQNFSQFRLVQNCIEIRPLDPFLTISGMVQVERMNIAFTRDRQGDQWITGDEGIPAVANKAGFSTQYKNGYYTVGVNSQPDWEFSPCLPQDQAISGVIGGTGGFVFSTYLAPSGYSLLPIPMPPPSTGTGANAAYSFLGMGNLKATVIRLSGLPTVTAGTGEDTYLKTKCSFNLRAWQAGEYAVSPQSLIYQFASTSPPEDPAALRVYRDAIDVMPTAVTADQNDTFWQTLVSSLWSGIKDLPRIAGSFFTGNIPGFVSGIANSRAFTPRLISNLFKSGRGNNIKRSTGFSSNSDWFDGNMTGWSSKYPGRPTQQTWMQDYIRV